MGTEPKSNKKGTADGQVESLIDPAAQLHEIQKLLFGQQINQLETVISELKVEVKNQLSSLDKKFSQSLDKQRKDFASQLSELSRYVDKTNDEHGNREAVIEDDLDDLRKTLENFESQTESAHDALEKQLLAESEKLAEELNAKHDDALAKLKTNSSSLDDKKLDRASLAELLSNVAQSIHPQS